MSERMPSCVLCRFTYDDHGEGHHAADCPTRAPAAPQSDQPEQGIRQERMLSRIMGLEDGTDATLHEVWDKWLELDCDKVLFTQWLSEKIEAAPSSQPVQRHGKTDKQTALLAAVECAIKNLNTSMELGKHPTPCHCYACALKKAYFDQPERGIADVAAPAVQPSPASADARELAGRVDALYREYGQYVNVSMIAALLESLRSKTLTVGADARGLAKAILSIYDDPDSIADSAITQGAALLESFRAETLEQAAQLAYDYVGTREDTEPSELRDMILALSPDRAVQPSPAKEWRLESPLDHGKFKQMFMDALPSPASADELDWKSLETWIDRKTCSYCGPHGGDTAPDAKGNEFHLTDHDEYGRVHMIPAQRLRGFGKPFFPCSARGALIVKELRKQLESFHVPVSASADARELAHKITEAIRVAMRDRFDAREPSGHAWDEQRRVAHETIQAQRESIAALLGSFRNKPAVISADARGWAERVDALYREYGQYVNVSMIAALLESFRAETLEQVRD